MNPRSKSRFLAVEKCRCAWPPARDARRPKAPPWPLHAPTAASSAQPLLSRLGGAVIEQRIDDGTIRDLPSAAAGRNARHHPFQTPQIGNLAVNCGDMIVEAETEFAPAADECEPFVMDRRRALLALGPHALNNIVSATPGIVLLSFVPEIVWRRYA